MWLGIEQKGGLNNILAWQTNFMQGFDVIVAFCQNTQN